MLKVEQFKNIKLLTGLPNKAIFKLLPCCILRNYDKGDIIFECNKKINSLFMVLSGEVDFCLPLKKKQKSPFTGQKKVKPSVYLLFYQKIV